MTPAAYIGRSDYRPHLAHCWESLRSGLANLPFKLQGVASLGPTSAFRLCSLCAIDILQSPPASSLSARVFERTRSMFVPGVGDESEGDDQVTKPNPHQTHTCYNLR